MTNAELNNLSIQELRELNKRIVDMVKLKMQIEGKLNLDNLHVGMTVKYKGRDEKLKNDRLEIKKISRVNAQCKSLTTGIVWNIKLANIEPATDTITNN